MNHHVKILDTSAPADVLVDNTKFPKHGIMNDECLSNVNISPVCMLDSKDAKCELA